MRKFSMVVLGVLAGAIAIPARAQQASLTVLCGVGGVCNATDTAWSLSKVLDAADVQTDASATFQVTVAKGATSDAFLTLPGELTITNSGSANAYVGNILVNLQRRSGKTWVTASSVAADATQGDAATGARICPTASSEGRSFFEENSASGSLEFTVDGNTVFSISPQFVLAPGETRTLAYRAVFNNTILGIPAGESIRAEAIVTFANAGARGGSGASCTNVDADGSGAVDPVEQNVRSVPCRTTVFTPVLEASNAQVALTDPADRLQTTGTVSVTAFDNGAIGDVLLLTGSAGPLPVTVGVDPGTDGGSVTNFAFLAASPAPVCNAPVDLEASATAFFVIPPPPPVQLCTFTQGGWGAPPNGNNAGALLAANFGAVYPTGVTIGGLRTARFTTANAIERYLPAGGRAGVLTLNLVNPTSTSAGVFGGQVLALQLNVDFSAAGVTPGGLGDYQVDVNGSPMSVSDILGIANTVLGGGTVAGFDVQTLNPLVTAINEKFDDCQ